jgi:hypothetical protein
VNGSRQIKERNHFVPKFFLKRFASRVEGEKAWLWLYRKEVTPKEVGVKAVGTGSFFYGKPESGIEDDLNPFEERTVSVLAAIDNGDDPNRHAQDLEELIWILFVRTRSLRNRILMTEKILREALLAELTSPKNKQKLRRIMLPKLEEQIRSIAQTLSTKQRRQLLANRHQMMAKTPLDHFAKEAAENFSNRWVTVVEQEIEKGHLRGIRGLLDSPTEQKGFLGINKWTLHSFEPAGLLLGDSCAFVYEDGAIRHLEKVSSRVTSSSVYLPISSSRLLLGRRTGNDALLPFGEINAASIRQSTEMFFGSKLDDGATRLTSDIGMSAIMLSAEEMHEMVTPIWTDLAA